MTDVTRILNAIEAGDAHAADRLLPLVYDQLRREAQRRMAGERSDHTLQATALVHEAYLRLVGDGQVSVRGDRGYLEIALHRALVQRLDVLKNVVDLEISDLDRAVR